MSKLQVVSQELAHVRKYVGVPTLDAATTLRWLHEITKALERDLEDMERRLKAELADGKISLEFDNAPQADTSVNDLVSERSGGDDD